MDPVAFDLRQLGLDPAAAVSDGQLQRLRAAVGLTVGRMDAPDQELYRLMFLEGLDEAQACVRLGLPAERAAAVMRIFLEA